MNWKEYHAEKQWTYKLENNRLGFTESSGKMQQPKRLIALALALICFRIYEPTSPKVGWWLMLCLYRAHLGSTVWFLLDQRFSVGFAMLVLVLL